MTAIGLRAAEANVIYRPGTAEVRVTHERDTAGVAADERWCGVIAGDADNKLPTNAAETERLVFVTFHTLVVRDGVDPAALHRAFLGIAEYRWSICPELAGSERRPGS